MNHLRLLIIAIATICVLALGVFALVNPSGSVYPTGGDDIIIKGGSLDIQCGANHGNDCLGTNDNTGHYKHKQNTKHITQIAVMSNTNSVLYSSAFDKDHQPSIAITYK